MSPHELPSLLVIADLDFAGSHAAFGRCINSLATAARRHDSQLAIQIRARRAAEAELAAVARTSRKTVGEEALLVLNGPAPLALELGYDGVHWPEASVPDSPLDPPVPAFRSAAAHSAGAVRRAGRAGATAVVYGPVFAPSWKEADPVGLKALGEAAAAARVPVYALGGIGPAQVGECLAAGAHGVAVLSGIAGAASPAAACEEYLAALGRPR